MMNLTLGVLTFSVTMLLLPLKNAFLIELPYRQRFVTNFVTITSGEPKREYNTIIDLSATYTWLFQDTSQSNSVSATIINKSSSITYKNKVFSAIEVMDKVSLLNDHYNVLPKFRLFKTTTDISLPLVRGADGLIGLGYNITNRNYSIIHQLKLYKLLDHLSFSILTTNSVVLGGILPKVINNKTYSYCDIVPKGDDWNCNITQVVIQTKDKDNKDETLRYVNALNSLVHFSTEDHYNFIPNECFDWLFNQVCKEETQDTKYKLINLNNKRVIYSTAIRDLFQGNMSIVIGGYSYTIDFSQLWDCYEMGCYFKLWENSKDMGNDWVLGSLFLSMLNTHFDYENNKIHFYSTNKLNVHLDNSTIPAFYLNRQIKMICYIMLSILSFGLILHIVSILIVNKNCFTLYK